MAARTEVVAQEDEVRLPVEPFAEYLRRVRDEVPNFNDIEDMHGWGQGFLSSIARGHQKTVRLEQVEAFLIYMDDPLALTRLYPL